MGLDRLLLGFGAVEFIFDHNPRSTSRHPAPPYFHKNPTSSAKSLLNHSAQALPKMAAVGFPSLAMSGTIPSGKTYSFVHVKPKDNKPYILFLHGFPESSYGWRHQIPYFQERGYGLIVPDLLGYGGTDKPKEVEAYRLKPMAEDLIAFLDAYGIEKVIGVGHDW